MVLECFSDVPLLMNGNKPLVLCNCASYFFSWFSWDVGEGGDAIIFLGWLDRREQVVLDVVPVPCKVRSV